MSPTRDSFPRLLPMEGPRPLPAPQRLWTDAEWDRIKLGLHAPSMDDKWDALVEGNRLFLHRSWSGRCVYEAVFTPCDGGHRITEAWVESAQNNQFALHSAFIEILITGHILNARDPELWARFTELGGVHALLRRSESS